MFMLSLYKTYVASMQFMYVYAEIYIVYAIFMQGFIQILCKLYTHLCRVYTGFMQFLCNFYVGFMQNTCKIYVKFTQDYAMFIHFKFFMQCFIHFLCSF
jgi:hypothetical protein